MKLPSSDEIFYGKYHLLFLVIVGFHSDSRSLRRELKNSTNPGWNTWAGAGRPWEFVTATMVTILRSISEPDEEKAAAITVNAFVHFPFFPAPGSVLPYERYITEGSSGENFRIGFLTVDYRSTAPAGIADSRIESLGVTEDFCGHRLGVCLVNIDGPGQRGCSLTGGSSTSEAVCLFCTKLIGNIVQV